jgi:threonine dehydrogenase-like Zn-dependent dehydrogenase
MPRLGHTPALALAAHGRRGRCTGRAGIHTLGGPAPVRRYLPDLIRLIWDRAIDPGKVFDLTLPLEQAAEGYQAMDQRRATKVLLTL